MRRFYYWLCVGSLCFLFGQGVSVMLAEWPPWIPFILAMTVLPLFAIPAIWDHRKQLLRSLSIPSHSRFHIIGGLLLPPMIGVAGAATVFAVSFALAPNLWPSTIEKPSFVLERPVVRDTGDGKATLSIPYVNGDVPVTIFLSRLIVLGEQLDSEPLSDAVLDSPNIIQPGQDLSHQWHKFPVSPDTGRLYVVAKLRFGSSASEDLISYDNYYAFKGVTEDGRFQSDLEFASVAEAAAIERYLEERGLVRGAAE